MIKMLIMDVDGTLTDGKIYIANQGELMKAFNVKDGLGIAKLCDKSIVPVIITGRNSEIVIQRAKELNIAEVIQGAHDKVKILKQVAEKYECKFNEIAYIGDDENDLECIKLCGVKGCPADAVNNVKMVADFVSQYNGGNGAVREFIEYLINISV
ncbi:MAG: 3-deoxy-D-manno-octulosonate 8-phosphate phosphatase [Desulfotomaculum sp. BICA1-6]|nr:MAG: 3-deoxy-D-manno-octulosonate 8-phosphate phosphatase [Desulfotomaculum sp. BICA1-6]